MRIEIGREEDGRWIAEVPDLPGVMVYGKTREQAISKAEALALKGWGQAFIFEFRKRAKSPEGRGSCLGESEGHTLSSPWKSRERNAPFLRK